MRIVAVCLGVVALAGVVILVIAGASGPHSNAMGPLAFLACIIAVIVMIVLGVTFGGRGRARAGAPDADAPEMNEPVSEPDR